MKHVLFVGWIARGQVPVVGETVKNQYIIEELEKYCKVIPIDFYQKNKHPWVYIQALLLFLRYPHAPVVLSTSAQNVYLMLRIFKLLRVKRHIIHWVVGGAFPQEVMNGRFKASVFNYVGLNLVQCQSMVEKLKIAGVTNVKYVSNFKKISYYPDLEKNLAIREHNSKKRFVFLGRLHPAKGCDYIVQAVELLNQKGYKEQFIVDFYGKFDESYQDLFLKSIETINNISYNGQLNLKESQGYDTLATYDAMLFPTYHPSEGFAGVFIDAFIASLPVLASNWAYNSDIINEKLGRIYPVHDVGALCQTMEDCIQGDLDLIQMARNVRLEAVKYDAQFVITEDYLKEVGLM